MVIPALFILCFLSIFAICISIIFYSFPLRRAPAIRCMIGVLGSCAVVSFFALLVYVVNDPAQKALFSRLRFIGYAGISQFWFLFIVTSFNRWSFFLKPWVLAALFASPVLVLTATLIPPLQHLVLRDFAPYSAYGLSVVSFKNGPLFYPHIVIGYLCLFASGILSGLVAIENKENRRIQILAIFGAAMIPIALDHYCIVTNSPLRWLMLNAASFVILGVTLAWTVFKHHFLDLSSLVVQKIFNDLPDPIVYLDSRDLLHGSNTAAEKTFGLNPSLTGRPLREVLPWLDRDRKEFLFKDSSGTQRDFFLQAEVLKDKQKRTFGTILLFRDITSQKLVEKNLHQNLDFKARLLEVITHDMAGNLQQQVRLSNLLTTQDLNQMKSTAHLLNDSALATYDLVENVMTWAKSQHRSFVPRVSNFEVNTLVKDCVSVLRPLASLQDLKIHTFFSEASILALGDSEMLAAVIRNLISNAIRASDDHSKIEIKVERFDREFQITVCDFGLGMDEETVSQLNQPKVNQEVRRSNGRSGYGVGLKIAQRFTAAHSGVIFFESELGRGTAVRLRVPLQIPGRELGRVSYPSLP